jgi:hypothetical protein
MVMAEQGVKCTVTVIQFGIGLAIDEEGNALPDSLMRAKIPADNNAPNINDTTNITQSNFLISNFGVRITWPNESNLYIYGTGNPITITDPTGEGVVGNFIRACGIVLGMAGGGLSDPGTATGNRPPIEIIQPVQPGSGQGPKPK